MYIRPKQPDFCALLALSFVDMLRKMCYHNVEVILLKENIPAVKQQPGMLFAVAKAPDPPNAKGMKGMRMRKTLNIGYNSPKEGKEDACGAFSAFHEAFG